MLQSELGYHGEHGHQKLDERNDMCICDSCSFGRTASKGQRQRNSKNCRELKANEQLCKGKAAWRAARHKRTVVLLLVQRGADNAAEGWHRCTPTLHAQD